MRVLGSRRDFPRRGRNTKDGRDGLAPASSGPCIHQNRQRLLPRIEIADINEIVKTRRLAGIC
jgi:hypothetical protein